MEEIWDSRNILRSLVVKNLIGRYKYSFLGFMWNFIVPVITLIVYYVVFTQIRISNIPDFWIFISSALFPFNFMISNLVGGSGCIISNSTLIKKIYFPKEIVVLSQIISSFIVMAIGCCFVILAIVISGHQLNICILLLVPLIVLIVLFTTGLTLFLSSITVYVRDVQYLLGSLSMVFYFMTPMYFMADSVSGLLSAIIWVNPFTYFVESIHYLVYLGVFPPIHYLTICVVLAIVALIVGVVVFTKLKKGFVERL